MSAPEPTVAVIPEAPEHGEFLRSLFASSREDLANLAMPEAQKGQLIDMQFRAKRMSYAATYPEAVYHVILADHEPIGNLIVDRTGDQIRILDVGLVASYRGRGIGTQLLRSLIEDAEGLGKPLVLYVAHGNPAERLYRRLGFTALTSDGVYLLMRREPAGPEGCTRT